MNIFDRLHNKVLLFRAIETLIDRPDFKMFYAENEQPKIDQLIMDGQLDLLKVEFSKWEEKVFDKVSMTRLRELAKMYKIPYYATMKKPQLLGAVRYAQETQQVNLLLSLRSEGPSSPVSEGDGFELLHQSSDGSSDGSESGTGCSEESSVCNETVSSSSLQNPGAEPGPIT